MVRDSVKLGSKTIMAALALSSLLPEDLLFYLGTSVKAIKCKNLFGMNNLL